MVFQRRPEGKAFDRSGTPPPLTATAANANQSAAAPSTLASETSVPLHEVASSSERPADADLAASIIGEDLSIEGQSITIRCRGSLQVEGNIQAELHGRQITVGEKGTVQGSIAADLVDVRGRVSGTIMGARVVLHPSAEVEGDIHAKSLSVADGASFEGRSRRVADAASVAPQLSPEMPTPFGNGQQARPPLPLQ